MAAQLTLDAYPGRALRVALFTDVSNGRRAAAARGAHSPPRLRMQRTAPLLTRLSRGAARCWRC
jgi:hypothetical protein